MDQSKIINRIKNLNKIKQIIEIAKFDTLKKIAKIQKVKEHHYEIARISQEIINFAKIKNKLSSKMHDNIYTKNKKILWIYITINSSIIKVSYDKYDKMICKQINFERDSFIAIGDHAIKFAKFKKLNIINEHKKIDKNYKGIAALISNSITNFEYGKILLVAQAPKTKDKPFEIFPFQDMKYDEYKMKNIKFYYSLMDAIDNIAHTYISNIIIGIYNESFKIFHKEKLVHHEESLDSIDKKLDILKISLNKNIRNKDSDEMIRSIQIASGKKWN